MHGGLGKLLRNLEELQVIIRDIFQDLMNLKLYIKHVGLYIPIYHQFPMHTAVSIKVVPRAKRKSLIRARKAAANR